MVKFVKSIKINQKVSIFLILALLSLSISFIYRLPLFSKPGLAIFDSDYEGELLAPASFIKNSILNKTSCLWNPYSLCGVPLAAFSNIGFFYMPNIITRLSFSPDMSNRILIFFHLFLTCIGLVLYVRLITHNLASSFVAALLFICCGPTMLTVCMASVHKLSTLSWWPWIFWITEKFIRTEKKIYLFLLSGGIGLSLLAGELQLFSLMLIFYSVYAIFAVRKNSGKKKYLLFRLFLSCLFGLLIGSIQLIPSAELTLLSARLRSFEASVSTSLPLSALLPLFLPYVDWFKEANSLEEILQFGSFFLVFTLWALIRKERYALLFTVFALFLILFAFGSPAYWVYYKFFPFARFMQGGDELAIPLMIVCPVIAAIGWGLFTKEKMRPPWRRGLFLVVFALDCLLLSEIHIRNSPRQNSRPHLKEEEKIIDIIKKDNPGSLGRIMRLGETDNIFNSNIPLIYSIYDIQGHFSFLLENYVNIIRSIDKRMIGAPGYVFGDEAEARSAYSFDVISLPVFNMLNMEYLVSAVSIENDAYKLIYDGTVKVYKNLRCLPRAFLVDKYEIINSEPEMLKILSDSAFSPSEKIYLKEKPVWRVGGANLPCLSENKARIVDYKPDKIIIETRSLNNSLLFISDAFYPGWRCFIDEQNVKIYRANHAFRAVAVPRGAHTVEFHYLPFTVRLGNMLFVFGLLLALRQLI